MSDHTPTWPSRKQEFSPFNNEADCISVGGITIENRIDAVAIYGSIDITRDKKGLIQAEILREAVCSIVNSLNSSDLVGALPNAVEKPLPTITVTNPFE